MTKSEQRAAWVTAIATATQTIAVVGTLIVALNEWFGHRSKDETDRRDAVIKLYFESNDLIDQARRLMLQVDYCANEKGDISSAPECKSVAVLTWDERIQPISTFQPLFLRVNVCVQNQLCEKSLALELFCDDQRYLKSIFRRYSASMKSDAELSYRNSIFAECFNQNSPSSPPTNNIASPPQDKPG